MSPPATAALPEPLEIAIHRAREEFIEGMAGLGFGFQPDAQSLSGKVAIPGRQAERRIEVCLLPGFPFRSPKVRPSDGSGNMSWHREREGWLCLYAEAENRHLPWRDPSRLLERVIEWFQRDEKGWPDDAPDLDLERYFERDHRLVVYKQLDALLGKPIYAKRTGHDVITVIGTGVAPAGKRPGRTVYGWAADLGELERPVHTWPELAAILGDRAERLARDIRQGKGELLLLKYRRREYSGSIALSATRGSTIELRALQAADGSEGTLRLRAGLDAPALADRTVAIVGIGAIGSRLAELLARSGISRLTLQDGQILRPGNCIRHLADLGYIGVRKAKAVRDILVSSKLLREDQAKHIDENLTDPMEAHRLLEENDLVVDATASGAVTAMLSFVAAAIRRPLLSICLQRDGEIARCDRWPLEPGESYAAEVPLLAEEGTILREGGCGEPVSPTSPSAILDAAALACRMATDLLTGRKRFGPSVVEVLVPQDDPPYDSLGVVG